MVLCLGSGLLAIPLLPDRARADRIDDALRCLEERAVLEERRSGMLRTAEELGRSIEAAGREDRGDVAALQRRAERLQRDALDLELEILTKREVCRGQAQEALLACLEQLRRIEEALDAGRAGPDEARELLRLREVRDRLQAGASEPAVLGYPLLPPDSSDTQETLRAKLQYHEDVLGHLRGLRRRVEARHREIREERRTLAEARRFLEDIAFIDEGGRVSAGGRAQFRGLPGAPGEPGETTPRAVAGGTETAGGEGNLELVLEWSPATPEESDRLLRILSGYGSSIEAELAAVERNLGEIRARILPSLVPKP